MHRVSRRLAAGWSAVVLPTLIAVAGMAGSTPFSGASAQETSAREAIQMQAQAEAPAESGRRRGRRGRSEKTETPPAVPPGMQQAAPLATFGDWNVFTAGQGRSRVCYAIAQPQTRTPKTLARDTGYLFVTVRKGENVQNEIAVMLGFKPKLAASQTKPGATAAPSDPYLTIGSSRYGLVAKDENAWIQNQAEEAKIVAEMAKTQNASVRTTSMRGNATNDEYALGGFAEALKRAREECK